MLLLCFRYMLDNDDGHCLQKHLTCIFSKIQLFEMYERKSVIAESNWSVSVNVLGTYRVVVETHKP